MSVVRTGTQEYPTVSDLRNETLPPQDKDCVKVNSRIMDWVKNVTFPDNGVTVIDQTTVTSLGRWIYPEAYQRFAYSLSLSDINDAFGSGNELKNAQSIELKFYTEDFGAGSTINASITTELQNLLDGQSIVVDDTVRSDENGDYISVFARNDNDENLVVPGLDISVVLFLGN